MEDTTALPRKLGKYEIRTLLGKGSMGMVFLGHDPTLGRDVAIKIMGGASVFDQQMRERFEREAKAVGRLHHPNIVTVHDLGYAREDLPFIAMERLEGNVLDELIEHDHTNQLPLSRKIEILVQVCRGLSHAHQHGIVHRDIKPANIFITTDGTAKIMDFGVARSTQSSQTQSGLVVGTAGYMAPEQISGQRIDGRADVFSVGVVLYEILTTEPLFPGDSLEAIFFATLSKKPPLLSLPDGTELPALQKILHRALARHPENRYSSAEELGKALETFLDQHANALPPNTIFAPGTSAKGGSNNRQRPTVQLPTPTRVPELATTVSPRPAPRSRPTGRTRRKNRFPLLAAVVLVAAVATGAYLLFLPQPETSRSHASTAPRPEPPVQPVPKVTPPPIEEPAPSEISATLLADAALAVSQDRLGTARSLIVEGERVDPGDARWAALREQLRAKEADAAWKSRASDYVRKGRRFLRAGQNQEAIDAFQEAMQRDPTSREARAGLDEAIDARTRIEAAPRPSRRFVESPTEFVAGPSEQSELLGFESQDDLEIKETADPFFPATVIIELEPVDARPGEPYVLRVKVFNEGYRLIELQSLQLASRFGNKTTGAGQEISVRTSIVAPQAIAILHEIAGVWKEAQNRGEIEATVTLADGSKLIKRLSW